VRTLVISDDLKLANNWIKSLDLADPLMESSMMQIESSFKDIWKGLEKELTSFKSYFGILAQENLDAKLEDNNELEVFEQVATLILNAKNGLSSLKTIFDFRPLYLDCSLLMQALNKMASASIEKIAMALGDKIVESCDYLDVAYSELDAKISVDSDHDAIKVGFLFSFSIVERFVEST
jgi:hypothetical protein